MKTRFSSALGFALLAASFTFGSSFVYAEAPEATTSALQTVGPNNETNVIEGLPDGSGGQAGVAQTGVADASVAEAGVAEAQPAEVDHLVSETEPSSTDELSPAIRSVDAIVVEVTQTVTIAVPGQDVEDNEDHTGSIRDASATEPIEIHSTARIKAAIHLRAGTMVPALGFPAMPASAASCNNRDFGSSRQQLDQRTSR